MHTYSHNLCGGKDILSAYHSGPEPQGTVLQEELRQASQTLPGAVVTDKAERSSIAMEASHLPTPLPSARAVDKQEVSVAEIPPVTLPPQAVEVVYDTPALEKQVSSASSSSQSESSKHKEAKEQAAPTEVVIPFTRRPPFVSGPFKERVKVPSIKLVPVADAKPAGKTISNSRPAFCVNTKHLSTYAVIVYWIKKTQAEVSYKSWNA